MTDLRHAAEHAWAELERLRAEGAGAHVMRRARIGAERAELRVERVLLEGLALGAVARGEE